MPKINVFLLNEYRNAYGLTAKKKYSIPKIYDANGDLSKRWCVYYSYLDPQTGKLQRMKNIYVKTNTYKTNEDRLSILTVYHKKLLSLLQEGFNPYEDNTDLSVKR